VDKTLQTRGNKAWKELARFLLSRICPQHTSDGIQKVDVKTI